FRRRTWRYGKRATIPLIAAVVVLLAAGGSYAFFVGGGNGPAASSGSVNLSKGLVGWWKMDGNVADATPYNTVCNSQYFTPSFTTDRKGAANHAFSIGAAKLGFNCGQPAALCTSNVTVSAWVNPSSYDSSGSGIVSYGGTVQFYFDSSGYLRFQVHDSSNVSHAFISPSAYSPGSWYDVTAAYDGSTVNMYVNGSNVLSTSYTGGIGTNHCADAGNNFLLANYGSDSTTKGFLGALDDIRYYNRALSVAEVTALYNSYNDPLDTNQGEVGLVGWWKLNGNYNDSTPYAISCSPQYFTPVYEADRKGRNPGALSLTGTNLGLDCGQPTSARVANISLSAWVKPTSWNSGDNGIAAYGAAYQLYFTPSGYLTFEVHDPSNVSHAFTSPSAYSTGNWYHVAATYDGTNVVLYVNGAAVLTTAYAGGIDTALYTTTGNDVVISNDASGSSTDGFLGALSDIRIYNRALTAAELTNIYNSYDSQISLGGGGQSTTTSINLQKGLVGYWPMNGNATDATPYSDNGTVSSATLTTDRKGRANSAYSFNGTSSYMALPGTWGGASLTQASVVAWYEVSATSGGFEAIIEPTDATFIHLQLNSSGNNEVYTDTGGINLPIVSQTPTGVWHQLVITTKSGDTREYLDGVQQGSSITTTYSYLLAATALQIGRGYSSGRYFNGSIDDVRIYDRALNAAEVQALYNEYQ
ncbi:MAG TPA: LamG domain-containing protein, partial [Candidatus Saccharimonadales bacterium]|nr:LamG domain-containing protein [Candidatus Saccharimonadales bacterium]